MATLFGYSTDTGEGYYAVLTNPTVRLPNAGFVASGIFMPPISPQTQRTIDVDPATGLLPEVWVRNPPADVQAALDAQAPGNPPPGISVYDLLANSIARVRANVVWDGTQLSIAQIGAWNTAHPTAVVFAVYEP